MSNNTAQIIGTTIIANDAGIDIETGLSGLDPNTMYIRIDAGDGNFNYINAFAVSQSLSDISKQVTTANASTLAQVNALKTDVNDKVSNVQFRELTSTVNTKANDSDLKKAINMIDDCISDDELNVLTNEVNRKTNNSDFETFKTTVTNDLDNKFEILDGKKANASDISSLTHQIHTIEQSLSSLDSYDTAAAKFNAIKSIKSKIDSLNSTIESLKGSSSGSGSTNSGVLLNLEVAVENLETSINKINGQIGSINTLLNNKASSVYVQNAIKELSDDINELSVNVAAKADAELLYSKASKNDLEYVADRLNRLSITVNESIKNIESYYSTISKDVKNKADKKTVDNIIAEMNAAIASKAPAAETIEKYNSLDKRLTELQTLDATSTSEVKCDIRSLQDSLNATKIVVDGISSNQSKNFQKYNDDIKALKDKDREFTNTLKNEWIRVMTPAEYQNLPTKPTYSDGSKNPNALQPNTIYFLMKSNKPYALYIGSTLIAKAEEKIGSTGFAYTFPIIF
jgi:hypothetical protein